MLRHKIQDLEGRGWPLSMAFSTITSQSIILHENLQYPQRDVVSDLSGHSEKITCLSVHLESMEPVWEAIL